MSKIDYKKELRVYYGASAKKVEFVDVGPMNYLMVDGKGDPGSTDFANAVEALFSVSYSIKFMIKKRSQVDYGVLPLEGLWWSDNMDSFITRDKSKWEWTAMIMQPELVSKELVSEAITVVEEKKNPTAINLIRFEEFTEGNCGQILHIGPFENEGPTIQELHKGIREIGELANKHHEIYLSDIRRAAPEKWRTILRQPYV